MPRTTIRDPDWEPYSRRLVLRATPAQLHELDVLAAEFGVARAWLVRRALARGLPDLVVELRAATAARLRLAGSSRRSPSVVLVEPGATVAPRKRRRVPPREWD